MKGEWISNKSLVEFQHPEHGTIFYIVKARDNLWDIEFAVEEGRGLDLYWNELVPGTIEDAKARAEEMAKDYIRGKISYLENFLSSLKESSNEK